MRKTETHFYFWNTIYSQWYTTEGQFTFAGVVYPNAEKYMMIEKARVFQDWDILAKMKNTDNAKEVKSLGRQIKNFSDEVWDEFKEDVVTKASYLKFSQNDDLFEQMLADRDLTLVEASPVDKIWGIGLHADNDDVLDESLWQGQNLLGKCLMRARDMLIEERNL